MVSTSSKAMEAVQGPWSAATSDINVLSWSAVFWAIVPIALNSMSQPSGRILGYQSSYNFVLRCSPVVCAFSAVDTIVRLIAFTIIESSTSRGLARFIILRFEDTHDAEDGSFMSLRKNKHFRAILFFLGAVPQFVKLCACKGIPWTQAWSVAFLMSFCVDELVTFAAFRVTTPTSDDPSARAVTNPLTIGGWPVYQVWTRAILWSSVAVGLGFFTHGIRALTILAFGDMNWVRIVIFGVLSLLWLCFALLPSYEPLLFFLVLLTILFTNSASNVASFAYSLVDLHSSGEPEWPKHVSLGIAALLSLAATMFNVERLLKAVAPQRAKYVHFGLGTYFVLLHLVAALLYYGLVYDATSTYKPQWTNFLR